MEKLKIVACIFFLVGCSPTTQITGSWKNPNQASKTFSSVIVTTLSQNIEARQTVEADLATALSANGVTVLKSLESVPPQFRDDKEIDKEELLKKIRKTGAEGILTVALINKQTENRYVRGNYTYAPITLFRYYGRFSGYYTTWYPTVHSQGYYEQDKIYFIEINFYDASNEDLLWSAQSETYNPSSLSKFSKEFAEVVVNKMKEDGVLIGI